MKDPLHLRIVRKVLPLRLRKVIRSMLPIPDFFLRKVSGVIHVGAHVGQERDLYAKYDLNVLWLEPNPEIFAVLAAAIKDYPKQNALPYLAANVEGKDYSLNISNNGGVSSSIFNLGAHRELWPEVGFTGSVAVKSVTLSSLASRGEIDMRKYDALVLDTQGAELLVLQGAVEILAHFKFIKAEAADFEIYKDCCQLADLDAFLGARGFRRVRTRRFARKRGVGSCYDAIYEHKKK